MECPKRTAAAIFLILIFLVWTASGQGNELKIEKLMTPEELRETGVGNLSPQQKGALNRWLVRYTNLVISAARSLKTESPQPRVSPGFTTKCSPAVESTISGDFGGWSGETIFKLDNGQIWEQAEYDFMYSYSYRPDVTIYATQLGCRMKVEGEEDTILVRRIK